jgi:hypothetical protein
MIRSGWVGWMDHRRLISEIGNSVAGLTVKKAMGSSVE